MFFLPPQCDQYCCSNDSRTESLDFCDTSWGQWLSSDGHVPENHGLVQSQC